jgi:hypothetical protein
MNQNKLLPATQKFFARGFTFIFFSLSAVIFLTTLAAAIRQTLGGEDITQVIVKMVNATVIAMAVYEVALVIGKEYGAEADHDVIVMLRRTLPRFVGTVCVALSLEGLMMVIKYSQLDMAGNLYYPVAIIVSASMLLMALGVFLRLAPRQVQEAGEDAQGVPLRCC